VPKKIFKVIFQKNRWSYQLAVNGENVPFSIADPSAQFVGKFSVDQRIDPGDRRLFWPKSRKRPNLRESFIGPFLSRIPCPIHPQGRSRNFQLILVSIR